MSDIKYKKFAEINLRDPFFDNLRMDYPEFDTWYQKKAMAGESAYVLYEENKLVCFVYLKIEDSLDTNIIPPLYPTRWVKIGTFKIEARRTKLGQRLIKRAFDFAISHNIFDLYVTAYDKHAVLIDILKHYGFVEYGNKGGEKVLVKHIISNNDLPTFSEVCGKLEQCPPMPKEFGNLRISRKNALQRYDQDINFRNCHKNCERFFKSYYAISNNRDLSFDFPTIFAKNVKKYILAIRAEYHTRMFPDSKLHTESPSVLLDTSEANSIHKVYITKMWGIEKMKKGDLIIIYRMKDNYHSSAHHRSVITSLCVLEEYRHIDTFQNEDDFLNYCNPHNIFTIEELKHFYKTKTFFHIIKMTYNMALEKRLTKGEVEKIIHKNPQRYWGFVPLNDQDFRKIILETKTDDSIIIH